MAFTSRPRGVRACTASRTCRRLICAEYASSCKTAPPGVPLPPGRAEQQTLSSTGQSTVYNARPDLPPEDGSHRRILAGPFGPANARGERRAPAYLRPESARTRPTLLEVATSRMAATIPAQGPKFHDVEDEA